MSFVLALISFLSLIFLLAGGLNNPPGETISLIILIVSVASSCIMFYSFARVGKYTDKKLLKIASWMVFAGILFILVILVLVILVGTSSSSSSSSLNGLYGSQDININLNADDFAGLGDSGLTGNAIVGIPGVSSATGFLFDLLLIGLVFFFVSLILFFVSLVEANEKVKFSKLGAIFGNLFVSSSSLLFVFSFTLALSLFFGGVPWWLYVVTSVPYLLAVLSFVFMGLSLFDASKKYEGESAHSDSFAGMHRHADHYTHEDNFSLE